ncbi:hypothetical protein QUF74_01530 [Candidatus Halobeggiatoa sp. HSG11]|nr:hypothetical protein [Candidatus Halobeggiatoa sp. HSG11]
MKKILQTAFILPLIVIAAIILVIYQVKNKPPIEHEVLQFPTKTVEVITAKELPFRTRATAYGNVEPAILLKAKTEVSGKISYIHPKLKQGGSLAKGTVVLRIEPTTFKFSLEQSEAGLVGSKSALKQLEVEEKTTNSSLKLAKQNLKVGQKELNRVLKMWKKKVISRSVVDTEEQKVLQLRQQVEDLQGKLSSYASRKNITKAQIEQSKTQLAQSKDTLGRTEIKLPFDARIGDVLVEKGEFTTVGNVLFEASGIQAVEIKAKLPTSQFRPLLIGLSHHSSNLQNPKALHAILTKMQLKATVYLIGNDMEKWQGKLIRIGESIDPIRDMVDLVVAVNNPYENVIPGKRPPLLKGMYVAVEFFAPAQKMLVIPRKAIHQGRVYIANADNKLEIRPVNILHKQGQLVIIEQGIEAGEKIVITDVIPVIEGLPLKPILADKYELQLAQDALGMGETK